MISSEVEEYMLLSVHHFKQTQKTGFLCCSRGNQKKLPPKKDSLHQSSNPGSLVNGKGGKLIDHQTDSQKLLRSPEPLALQAIWGCVFASSRLRQMFNFQGRKQTEIRTYKYQVLPSDLFGWFK